MKVLDSLLRTRVKKIEENIKTIENLTGMSTGSHVNTNTKFVYLDHPKGFNSTGSTGKTDPQQVYRYHV